MRTSRKRVEKKIAYKWRGETQKISFEMESINTTINILGNRKRISVENKEKL